MNVKTASFIVLLLCFGLPKLKAQVSIADSSIYLPMIGAGYGYFIPSGNMVERFGNCSAINLDLNFKTKSYWTFGLSGSFLFGNQVKEHLFDSIAHDNLIVNQGGDFADVRLYERGFTLTSNAGRLFPLGAKRPNCGLIARFGLGFIQHKIRIEVIGNDVPQLAKNYKPGYDRLTSGILLSENLGYLYLSNNRLVNFYFGLEGMQGFTQNRRSFDFDKMKRDDKKRLDMLWGAKVAWILPLFKKAPQEFYTY